MAPIAHGDDHGGSIRYPAQVCGVLGLRPTVGLVPRPVRVAPVRDVGIGAAEVVEARAGVLTRIRPRGRGTDGPDDVSRGGVR
jgi:amidase